MATFIPSTNAHTLDCLSGPSTNTLHALQATGTISSNVTFGTVVSGMCVHVGSVVAGAPPSFVFNMGANITKMPIFLWVGQDGYDVSNPGVASGPLGGSGGVADVEGGNGSTVVPEWIPIRPTGVVMGLVATGGYELETTEFDTAQTYAANEPLRAVTDDTNANAGKLSNKGNTGDGNPGFTSSAFTVYTDTVVGVVSRGSYRNKNGYMALAFWPVYLPGTR